MACTEGLGMPQETGVKSQGGQALGLEMSSTGPSPTQPGIFPSLGAPEK